MLKLSDERRAIKDGVAAVCKRFGDDYWSRCENDAHFPFEFLTHGGMGYAKEYQVERLLREVLVARIAPVSEQMLLSFIAEKVLDQPKSY